MQISNEMVAGAAKALEKRIKQSTYGWSDDQFEIWWTKDPRFVQKENSWGDAFGRGTMKDHLLWMVRITLESALTNRKDRVSAALLETLKFAVARVRIANTEGDPILSAWLPGADALIAEAQGRIDARISPSTTSSDAAALDALRRAERFMSGFESDYHQLGIDADLEAIRSAITCLVDGVAVRTSSREHGEGGPLATALTLLSDLTAERTDEHGWPVAREATMTSPLETLSWLAAQFRDRAEDDPAPHTETDASEVEALRACFVEMLAVLRRDLSILADVAAELTPEVAGGTKLIAGIQIREQEILAVIDRAEGSSGMVADDGTDSRIDEIARASGRSEGGRDADQT